MNTPTLIAIVPHESWRERLLGRGLCGSMPPMLWRTDTRGWSPPIHGIIAPNAERALPLIWEGEFVPDGIARSVRAWEAHHGLSLFSVLLTRRWNSNFAYLAESLVRVGIAAEVITESSP